MKREILQAHFDELRAAFQTVAEQQADVILACGRKLVETLRVGNKILICGNGGSASDAQHLAAELVGRFLKERPGLPAIALTTDSSILTAIGNDYGFDEVFSRQVQALAQPGDLVVGISTSGNSPNIHHAMLAAGRSGCATVALLGRDGGVIAQVVDLPIIVAFQSTPVIQTLHGAIIHFLCGLVEEELFPAMDA